MIEEIYEYISESGIYHQIRDFAFGNPRSNYDNVIAEIDSIFNKNVCSGNCRYRTRFYFGTFGRVPQLVRQTHDICPICKFIPLSDYDHIACFECANEDEHPLEFEYFHSRCN